MRFVFDTNILISSLTLPGGKSEAAVSRIISGDTLIISHKIINAVLTEPARKFSKYAEALRRTEMRSMMDLKTDHRMRVCQSCRGDCKRRHGPAYAEEVPAYKDQP